MAIPLRRDEDTFAVLMIERASRESWSTEETDFAIRLGTHLSLAEQRDRLFNTERVRARLSEALNDIDDLIHSSLDFGDIMRSALAQGVDVLECDSGSVTLREDDRWVARYQYGMGEEVLGMSFSDKELPFVATLREHQAPVVFTEPSAPGRMEEFADEQRIAQYLVAPLLSATRSSASCSSTGTIRPARSTDYNRTSPTGLRLRSR